MTQSGFLEQKSIRPTGFVLVVALHAAALTALALIKPPIFFDSTVRTRIYDVIPIRDPEPLPPEPERQVEPRPAEHQSQLDAPAPPLDRSIAFPIPARDPAPPLPPLGQVGEQRVAEPPAEPRPAPIRTEAEFDPRYARDLQPDYPSSEQRAERDGVVRIALTIGADGRVKSVERISATSDAFWRATERHARARWRFRPATVDGRAVESRKVMNLYFRIED